MSVLDILGEGKKHCVMQDTWGHLYPEPGKKYYGEMLIAVGEYGGEMIVKSDFPGLEGSPQRFELEHSIFDHEGFDPGVYHVKCGLWFFKTCNDGAIGRIIKVSYKQAI